MRVTRKLQSLANVGAGQQATLNCEVGLSYDRIELEYSGVTLEQMKNLQVVINGKPVMTFKDAKRIEALNDYYGRPKTAGFLTLYFARPEMATLEMQRLTSLGTLDVATLALNIDIDAAAAAPVIKAHSVMSEPAPLGSFIKVKEFQFDSSVTGDMEISTLPKGPRILAMHLFKSDIDKFELELDSQKVFSASKNLAQSIQKSHGRVPQTALATHFDTALEGDLAQALVTRNTQAMTVRPTLASAGAVSITIEYLDGFAGI